MPESVELIRGDVLNEFEGRPAAIVVLQAGDELTFEEDLKEHALNLAKNQETPVEPNTGNSIKNAIVGFGRRISRIPVVGELIKRKRSDLTKRIETLGERRKDALKHMIHEGADQDGNATEFAEIFRARNADHLDEVYRKGGYKIVYADPKVNVLSW